jgi:hypothetical protein
VVIFWPNACRARLIKERKKGAHRCAMSEHRRLEDGFTESGCAGSLKAEA